MPELPEVETTRRGIAPHLEGRTLLGAVVRQPQLRYPVTPHLDRRLKGQRVREVARRGKYLLVRLSKGSLIIHLGMSGSLRVLDADAPPRTHDHLDILFDGRCLRLHDPRRFGLVIWTEGPAEDHPLLRGLGPEPLGDEFTAAYLHQAASRRRVAVKNFIMDSHVVVGVGNIYANESLFAAGIHPLRRADRISLARYSKLRDTIRDVLSGAIRKGGTTLRDFVNENGNPGYFSLSLKVYGRTGQPCPVCGSPVRQCITGQRSTFYCPRCQR